jgi:hypothetical protein
MTDEISIGGVKINGLNSVCFAYPFLLIGLMQSMSREKAGTSSVVAVMSRGLKTVPRYNRFGNLTDL